ncbi:MAG: hypothetical protein ACI4V1_07110 [Eubacteriales bacterium]
MADIVVPVLGGMFDSTTVVETVNGFPRGDKAVDASFFAKMISSFYSDGILAAGTYGQGGFAVAPAGGLTVSVAPGIAWIRGYMAWMKEAQNLVLSAGHSYTIVLRLNTASGEFTLVAAEDNLSLPTDTELIRDLVLAEVTIQAVCTALTADMLTDTRSDPEKCGFVTCTIDALATVPFAENAGAVGGVPGSSLLCRTGGTMSGNLIAAPETTGQAVVRNIRYGTVLPEVLEEGEIFLLLTE